MRHSRKAQTIRILVMTWEPGMEVSQTQPHSDEEKVQRAHRLAIV
nr:MAG TPA: hypothetical protein [Caudoviricetes sp.]